MSDPCSWPISCEYECTSAGEDDPDCPYWTSTVGERSYSFPIQSETTIDMWGNVLYLYKVDRQLNYGYTVSAKRATDCDPPERFGTSSISESCTYIETEVHYLNQTEQVAVYTEKTITLSFTNSSNEFAALAVGSAPVWFLKLPAGAVTYSIDSKVVLLKGSEKLIQDSYQQSSTADTKLFFLLPTPDPRFAGGIPMDAEIKQYGFYNQYESCFDAALNPDSKVALDGGRDMFFPEWLRNFVKDPNTEQHRNQRFSWCVGENFEPGSRAMPWSPSVISPVPCGSYAKHPEWGEMYNFFVRAVSHSGMLNIKSDNLDNAIISEVNNYQQDGEKDVLGDYTLYYPISLV